MNTYEQDAKNGTLTFAWTGPPLDVDMKGFTGTITEDYSTSHLVRQVKQPDDYLGPALDWHTFPVGSITVTGTMTLSKENYWAFMKLLNRKKAYRTKTIKHKGRRVKKILKPSRNK